MAATFTIQGFDEARMVMDVLPDKLQAKVLRKMFMKAAKPMVADAQSRVTAHDPGYRKLAKAIGFIPTNANRALILVGVRAKGPFKDVGYYGHWVEYGVSGVKNKTSKTITKPEDESYRFWVAKVKRGGRYRNDIAPQPFMRPAIDTKKETVKKDVIAQMELTLYAETEKALRKYKAK